MQCIIKISGTFAFRIIVILVSRSVMKRLETRIHHLRWWITALFQASQRNDPSRKNSFRQQRIVTVDFGENGVEGTGALQACISWVNLIPLFKPNTSGLQKLIKHANTHCYNIWAVLCSHSRGWWGWNRRSPAPPPILPLLLPQSSVVIDLIVHPVHEYSTQRDGWC